MEHNCQHLTTHQTALCIDLSECSSTRVVLLKTLTTLRIGLEHPQYIFFHTLYLNLNPKRKSLNFGDKPLVVNGFSIPRSETFPDILKDLKSDKDSHTVLHMMDGYNRKPNAIVDEAKVLYSGNPIVMSAVGHHQKLVNALGSIHSDDDEMDFESQ